MELPDSLQEQAIDDFLEGQPRASQWRQMRESLEARLHDALRARDAAVAAAEPSADSLGRRVRELQEQVRALAQEEAVTQFVEDSVRSSLLRPAAFEFDEEEY